MQALPKGCVQVARHIGEGIVGCQEAQQRCTPPGAGGLPLQQAVDGPPPAAAVRVRDDREWVVAVGEQCRAAALLPAESWTALEDLYCIACCGRGGMIAGISPHSKTLLRRVPGETQGWAKCMPTGLVRLRARKQGESPFCYVLACPIDGSSQRFQKPSTSLIKKREDG